MLGELERYGHNDDERELYNSHTHSHDDEACRCKVVPGRYKSHCQGRCSIPYLEDLHWVETGL